MRRPWHNPPTSNMRTGTLRFYATCILGITPARWSITRHTAESFRKIPRSSNGLPTFATAQRNRRSDEKNHHSLDSTFVPCLGARGCACAASGAAKDGSSTGAHGKAAGKDRRGKDRRGKEGGCKETD